MTKNKIITPLILFFACSLLVFPQYAYYYGKNKVIAQQFDWQVLESENFLVHYYSSDLGLIQRIAKSAEEAYSVLSKYLGIKREKKIPIIFYRNHIEFEQTNLADVRIGIEGFAESLAQRVVLHGDRAFEDIRRTLTHELGHIFEYLILYQNVKSGSFYVRRPPMWIIEGFSEFVTQDWDSFYEMMVRDLVVNDNIPILNENVDVSGSNIGRRTAWYDMGHLLYNYIYESYGEIGIRRIFQSLRGGKFFGTYRQFFKMFNTTRKVFNYEFTQWAKKRFAEFQSRENPENYSLRIGPDSPYVVTFSHQISPSGDLLAILTVNRRNGEYDVVLISAEDGKVIKNITPGLSFKDFDQIYSAQLFNPATGTKIAWDPQAEHVAFFARKDIFNYLVIVDILTNQIEKKIKLPGINEPSSIVYHPTRKMLYFTALENSRAFIYRIDPDSEEISRVSDGSLFLRSFHISPDGEKIVSSARLGDYYKLIYSSIQAPDRGKQITFGPSNDITPRFTADGNQILYSSDERGAFNIYSIDLDSREKSRYSDVQTGNFFPVPVPGEPDRLIISSFFKGSFSLYNLDRSQPRQQERVSFSPEIVFPEEDPRRVARRDPNLTLPPIDWRETFHLSDQEPEKQQKVRLDEDFQFRDYKPLDRLVIRALPTFGVGYSSYGSLAGSGYINITDLMQDQIFTIFASSEYLYNRYFINYLNQKGRLQYYASASYYSYAFWVPFQEGNVISYEREVASRQYGVDLGLYLPLSRYYRLQAGLGFKNQDRNYSEIFNIGPLPYAQFTSGLNVPLSLSLTGETTVFTRFGPLMGHTFNLSYINYLDFGDDFVSGYTLTADLRKYFRITNQMLVAARLWGFYSDGENPMLFWSGGNNTIRSTRFYSLSGTRGFTFTAELRFPLISFAPSIIGNIGPIRGVVFFDTGGVWEEGSNFRYLRDGKFRLQDGLASYGIGLEMFLLGIPVHIELVNQTDFNARKYYGVNFWIGYDF